MPPQGFEPLSSQMRNSRSPTTLSPFKEVITLSDTEPCEAGQKKLYVPVLRA